MFPLDKDLAKSIRAAHSYPQNIVSRTTDAYSWTLKAATTLLDEATPLLFVREEKEIDLTFRDLNPAEAVQKRNIHEEGKELEWLGVQSMVNEKRPHKPPFIYAQRKDPKCRLVYIYALHSRASLRVSRSMLTNVLSYHQVMPAYLDFVLAFGLKHEPDDLKFSSFMEQTTLADHHLTPRAVQIGRSGQQFQLCYNLRTATKKSEEIRTASKGTEESYLQHFQEWSIQSAAIHHQFDVVEGTTLWIITKGGRDLYERYKEFTTSSSRSDDPTFATTQECLRSALSTHLLFCNWSTEGWRWYLKWIETTVEDETGLAGYEDTPSKIYKSEDIMALHRHLDKAAGIVIALETNIKILTLLRDYYSRLSKEQNFPNALLNDCKSDLQKFNTKIDAIVQNLGMELTRANLLVDIIKDRKELIVQHLQTQASERMEAVSTRMEREAIAVRMLTIIFGVYLPGSFVSGFFSTDVAHYSPNEKDQEVFSIVALRRWLTLTIPLTVLTLIFVYWSHTFAKKTSAFNRFRFANANEIASSMGSFVTSRKRKTKMTTMV